MHIYNQLTYINNSSLGLGFFDGLHLGHKVVLKNVIHVAKKYNTQSVVILFNEHPVNVLSSTKIPEIITLDEKIKMLDELGIDNVVILDFKSILSMKADDYLQDILVKYFSPIAISIACRNQIAFPSSSGKTELSSSLT